MYTQISQNNIAFYTENYPVNRKNELTENTISFMKLIVVIAK